jgi:hypothetical protein
MVGTEYGKDQGTLGMRCKPLDGLGQSTATHLTSKPCSCCAPYPPFHDCFHTWGGPQSFKHRNQAELNGSIFQAIVFWFRENRTCLEWGTFSRFRISSCVPASSPSYSESNPFNVGDKEGYIFWGCLLGCRHYVAGSWETAYLRKLSPNTRC